MLRDTLLPFFKQVLVVPEHAGGPHAAMDHRGAIHVSIGALPDQHDACADDAAPATRSRPATPPGLAKGRLALARLGAIRRRTGSTRGA